MAKTIPQVDAYIAKAAPFAQPILNHLRALVHKACPGAEEKWKWSSPHFDYKEGPLCHMAAFKAHCAFGFWKAALMKDQSALPDANRDEAMGQFGRITSLKDLPSDKVIIALIKEAMQLNEEGKKLTQKKPTEKEKKELETPDYLGAAIKKNRKAAATWDGFSYSHRKEYIEWITEAKTEATREKRVAQAIEWMAEGKQRHWKYKV